MFENAFFHTGYTGICGFHRQSISGKQHKKKKFSPSNWLLTTRFPYIFFQAYNIHINGLFHCTVRYKQLLNLHEQLAKDLDVPLPHFPPKKFFPLTANQQEDRRLALERYIQTIGQNTTINNSELLNGFLLNAQQESGDRSTENENFDVFLMNGQSITVKVSTADNSTNVLKVCSFMQ